MSEQTTAPIPGIMVGLTHDRNLMPLIREPRVLKVGIGVPKGRASYIYTHQGRWIVRYGAWEGQKLIMKTGVGSDGRNGFATRAETEDWYAKNKASFAVSNRPQKIPFFTFTRRTVVEIQGKPEEIFEPDFSAIEAHGDTPREVDIVFMGDNPLFGEFQAWSATELKCHGDGLHALRVLALGNDQWPGWSEAKAATQKYFPISECFASGLCPYAQDGGKDKLVCKPMMTLSFQLANSIRLGATAYFTTTSFRSVTNLFSSLEIIRSMADRAGSSISNTPMKLVLAPFRTNHNGIAATQYGVSLELRTQDVQKLREMLSQSAWKPAAPRMLTPVPDEDIPDLTAAEMTREFVPDAPEFEDGEAEEIPAERATNAKTADLGEKLASARTKEQPKADNGSAKTQAPVATAPVVGQTDTRQSAGTISEIPTAPPPAATETQGRPPMPDAKDALWQKRVQETFFTQLGKDEFRAILQRITGSIDIISVKYANYKTVWAAMEAAVKGNAVPQAAPQPAPAPVSKPASIDGQEDLF